ncbi:MAG TPA: Lrp/AsnC family transcriptional regulator [Taishania sp.]|nr:Lrp/AsnC family transcriptional regulator [Taishania sp.]
MEKENLTSTINLDAIDLQILDLLRRDAKQGTKEIAQKIELTTTPTYERIKRLEKNGVIKRYTAIIDNKKLGYDLTLFCNVQLKSHTSEYLTEFEAAIIGLKEVKECYHIAGNFDYLLKIDIENMNEYATFVKDKLTVIPHIATVQSSFVMRTLKAEY